MKKNDSLWLFIELGVACCYAATLLYKLVYPEPNDRLLGIIWMVLGMTALIAPLVHLYFKVTAGKSERMIDAPQKQDSAAKTEHSEKKELNTDKHVPATSFPDIPSDGASADTNTADRDATAEDAAPDSADNSNNAAIPVDAPFIEDPLSKAFFDGLVEANFLDADYQPNTSIKKSQLVYIVATVSDILNINTCWSAYEKFWKMTNFRQNYNSMFKRDSSVTNKEAIDRVFLRVGLNNDRIKDLRTFIRWRAGMPQ